MHTQEELRIMTDYHNSVDQDVKEFVEKVISGEKSYNYITVAFLSANASHRIAELTEKNVDGSRVVLDVNAVKHITKRHDMEGEQDSSMSDIEDIARIGYVITNYDEITYKGTKSLGYLDEEGNPSPTVIISKKIDGTYFVVEAVNSAKSRKCYVVSAYIRKQ